VTPFEVALAHPYKAEFDLSGFGYVEPKIDGLRMTVVDGVGYTRQGNEVQGVGPILAQLASYTNYVFDGEVISAGSFESTISKARTAGQANRGLTYHVFDLIRREDWFARKTAVFAGRREELEELFPLSLGPVRLVPSELVEDVTMDQLVVYRDRFIAQGFEGAMWKRSAAPYSFRRTDDIVKIKRFETVDAAVVGTYEGEGKYKGMLGGLVLRLENGLEMRCGSGFTEAQRVAYWKNALPSWTIEVKFQNETAAGRLRFPVFIRFRMDK
jgi:DNA ligase-1